MSSPSAPATPRPCPRMVRLLIWGHVVATLASLGALLFTRPAPRVLPSLVELVFSAVNIPVFPSLVSVALLMLVSSGLVRRKRLALWGVIAFQVSGALVSTLHLIDVLRYTLPEPPDASLWPLLLSDLASPFAAILILILAWRFRHEFPGSVARRSWPLALTAAVVGLVLTIAVTHVLLLLTHGESDERNILLYSLARAVGLVGGHRLSDVSMLVPTVVGILLGATILISAALFLRSPRMRRSRTGAQEVAVRELLSQYGQQDSLSYFATRRDKDYVFSRDGRAVIAFQASGSVAVAAGDPIGPREAWDDAIAMFLAECRRHGWMPAVLSAGEEAARAWTAHGLMAVVMGDEAILEPEVLEQAGLAEVRRAAARARGEGLTVRIRRHSALTDEERADMVRYADQWRHDGDERGFSMALSRLGDPADGSCILVSAHGPDGTWHGLLSFVPWGRSGASLDVMRRSPDAPHGVTELMVSTLLQEGSRLGVTRVSLNFAMFRHVFDDAQKLGADFPTRLVAAVLQKADRWFQLERLYRSNQKYCPTWVPRYMLADGLATLPRTALAAGALEGFVPRLSPTWPTGPLTEEQLAAVAEIDARMPEISDLAPRRSDQSRHRLRHAEVLRAAGMEPYPVGLPEPMPLAAAVALVQEGAPSAPTNPTPDPLRVAGRVRHLRDLGGVLFAEIVDGAASLQLLLERDVLGAESFDLFAAVDRGDIVQAVGRPGRSRRGEPSLLVEQWVMASKSLQPIPFDSFEDPEARLRNRATDMVVHPRAVDLLRARSTVIQSVRSTLLQAGLLEVETPVLATVHGGANARPFRTRINAYSTDLTLRIAPELQLKRLMVGGMGAIFEIGRNFRNEGADATHNPEFTALEAYVPYSDYMRMRELTEQIIKDACRAVHGREAMPIGGVMTDISGPWAVESVCEAVSRAVGRPVDVHTDIDELLALTRAHGIEVRDDMGPGALIEELYGELVEPTTTLPTFYVDFPAETSPLTAPHRSKDGLVERWDLVVGGMELGTAYSELADPLIQRDRLTAQSLKAAAGDAEAMEVDETFLHALEIGMPPAGGLGIGMDRLVMALTDTTIREVLAFPFVRPMHRHR